MTKVQGEMADAAQASLGCTDPKALKLGDKALARNTGFNLIGQLLPFAIGLLTIPFVVRTLGVDRFGVLSLAWAILGYFTLFDLGLGRATTKVAAECFARNDLEALPKLAWTSILVQVVIGLIGAGVSFALVPLVVSSVLKLNGPIAVEASQTFYILCAALPIVLASNTYRGILEAGQRFDLVNYVKVPTTALLFVGPAVAVALRNSLPVVVTSIVLSIVLSAVVYALAAVRIFPSLRRLVYDGKMIRTLANFGGWITVSNVVGPLLTYTDRVLIGAHLSVAHTSYYSVPSDAATRLWVFPRSLTSTLFPAFSSFDELRATDRVSQLYVRSLKLLAVALALAIGPLIVLADVILRVWMGADFAVQSSPVLRIAVIGVLINSIAWIPFNLLQGVGRPDLTAKFHLVELPWYVGTLWPLVIYFGICGAAIAWTLRHVLEAVLLFASCHKLGLVFLDRYQRHDLTRTLAFVFGFIAASCATVVIPDPYIRLLLTAVLAGGFGWFGWNLLLNTDDRQFVLASVPYLHRCNRLLSSEPLQADDNV